MCSSSVSALGQSSELLGISPCGSFIAEHTLSPHPTHPHPSVGPRVFITSKFLFHQPKSNSRGTILILI